MSRKRIVVIGGGFAGIETVKALAKADVDITLIDRRNFHLFQPLLYQVATGSLSPANIATPLRHLFRRKRNVAVRLGTVSAIDVEQKSVTVDEDTIPYDTLVVAAGSRPHYFGHPEWEQFAPSLKTIEDATSIRSRVFTAFEAAERTKDFHQQRAHLTFVVVGGGPTSIELAGALSEIAHHTLRKEFRIIDPTTARIVIVEANDRVIGQFSPDSSQHVASFLEELHVELMTNSRVTKVDEGGVSVTGPAGPIRIDAATVLWAAGVVASPLAAMLAAATGQTLDRGGRLPVDEYCAVPRHPEIFAIGDLALFTQWGSPLPGLAQVAMQQGTHVAKAIIADRKQQPRPKFVYRSKGIMATIGKRRAVVEFGKVHVSGRLAWFMWLTLHLAKLVRAENRILVFIQWAWAYVTWNRSARLISVIPSPKNTQSPTARWSNPAPAATKTPSSGQRFLRDPSLLNGSAPR